MTGRRPVPDGGYEGDAEEQDNGPKTVRLERVAYYYSSSQHPYTLVIGGVNKGILYLSEEEAEWLKPRIEGTIGEEGE